jgi:hypothetical protein
LANRLLSAPIGGANPLAFTADSSLSRAPRIARIDEHITGIEIMPSDAMRDSQASVAVHLRADSACSILLICHWLKVIRINAAAIATQVVQVLSRWDRSLVQFVANAMGSFRCPVAHELPIPLAVYGRNPNPAAALNLLNLWKERFLQRLPFLRISDLAHAAMMLPKYALVNSTGDAHE